MENIIKKLLEEDDDSENIIIETEESLDEEEEKEKELSNMISNIKIMFDNAKKRTDYDKIIRTFNIKIKKNGSNVSPIPLKMNIKRKIIQFVIHEPEDIFDYDHYISKI